jgi:hypothetical protein
MDRAEFRRRAAEIARRRSWRLDIQEPPVLPRQIEAWFSDPAQRDVDTAQAYMIDGQDPVGLVELEGP